MNRCASGLFACSQGRRAMPLDALVGADQPMHIGEPHRAIGFGHEIQR